MTVATLQRFAVEFRSEFLDDGRRLVGRAAVFGQVANVGPHWERIERRAIDAVLADPETDVRALINHDPAKLLGRQSSGTLELRATDDGLDYEILLPDTSYAHDLRTLVERRDMTGGSFGFVPGEDTWSRASDGRRIRTHTLLRSLRDVSPVTFPAYTGTDGVLYLRSLDVEGIDLADFETEADPEAESDEEQPPPIPDPEQPGPPADGLTATGPDADAVDRRSANRSSLIRARARVHLPSKEQQ